MFCSSSSVASAIGRAREASIAEGVRNSSEGEEGFLCFVGGESAWVATEGRFFKVRLAALRICFANFSSGNKFWSVSGFDLAIDAGLTVVQHYP